MRLPRDLSGDRLVALLSGLGYAVSRQTGSHIRLACNVMGYDHHITVPRHEALRVGTLSGILSDVAAYLRITREELEATLFGR